MTDQTGDPPPSDFSGGRPQRPLPARRPSDETLPSRPVERFTASRQTRAIAGLTEELKGRISLDIPADLWVLADAERLPMVISNLLTNAGKYAPGSPYRLVVRRGSREQLRQKRHLLGRKEADGKEARNAGTLWRPCTCDARRHHRCSSVRHLLGSRVVHGNERGHLRETLDVG